MAGPSLTIDLEKIEANACAITSLCSRYGITVAGVTKATCGLPQVARAMLGGGVSEIADSRLENVRRLRASGITCPLMLLRIPPLSEVEEIVTSVDLSLNSELSVIKGLSEAAERHGLVHEIILMVDLGDLREGIWPDDLIPLVREVVGLPGVRIAGVGTNLTCYGGVLPNEENMGVLVAYARRLEEIFGLRLRYVSGGNSSSLPLLASGKMPAGINHLRIGEAILLGRETIHRQPWPGTRQDAFLLSAEIIELKEKPSLPVGQTGEDAFGGRPSFEDRGERLRAILNVGREDVHVEGLTPVASNLEILGSSSDHLLVDVTEAAPEVALGDRLSFQLNYAALLAAMTSDYVEKHPVRGKEPDRSTHRIWLGGEAKLIEAFRSEGLIEAFDRIGHEVVVPFDAPSLEAAGPSGIQEITSQIDRALEEGRLPLVIGPDEGFSLAVLLALSGRLDAFGLIWIDARVACPHSKHRSIGSGALLTALGYGSDPRYERIKSHLSPENVVLIGLREADPEEADLLTRARVRVYTMEDIDELGIREVLLRAIRRADAGTRGIHVHFCPNVVENLAGPGSVGGLTYRETHLALEKVARSGLMRSMDVTCFPSTAGKRIIQRTKEFILSTFGKRILGG